MGSDAKKPIPRTVREEAARQLYERHLDQVKRIIRLRLNARVRRREGTSDIFQDAVKSFAESDAVTTDPDNLLPRFLGFVSRKCKNAIRDQRAAIRDVDRESTLTSGDADEHEHDPWDEIPDLVSLTSLDAAILHEELDRLDDEEFDAIVMRVAGHTYAEIAQALNCSEETARRCVQRILNRWTAN